MKPGVACETQVTSASTCSPEYLHANFSDGLEVAGFPSAANITAPPPRETRSLLAANARFRFAADSHTDAWGSC